MDPLPCSLYHRNAGLNSSGGEAPLFVFIPGNPGLIEFYEPFLAQIHEKNPAWEILGISHAGMNSCSEEVSPVYSLEQQIDHKIEIINRYCLDGKPIIIMGHSVGAFMVQKITTSRRLKSKVIRVGLLTPTVIDIHKSEKGVKLTSITRWCPSFHNVVSTLNWALFEKLLPTKITKSIISLLVDDPQSCLGATTELLVTNSRFVKQALGLAAEEVRVIRSDWAYQKEFLLLCQENDTKIWWLFSEKDHWVSPTTRNDIIDFYRQHSSPALSQIDVSSTIEHAFVRRHADLVIKQYF